MLFIGCRVLPINDIYKSIPKDSDLSLDVLKKSNQIIPNGSDLILNYDISTLWDRFDPHLLFYNSELKLYAASYFPSHQIESVEENEVIGVLYQANKTRKKYFRNELPRDYKMKFISRKVNGGKRMSNKIIEKIKILPKAKNVKLFVSKSKNINAGLRRIGKEDFADIFTERDTLIYPIVKLNFDYSQNLVFTTFQDLDQKLIRDNMLISDSSVLDSLYIDLMALYK